MKKIPDNEQERIDLGTRLIPAVLCGILQRIVASETPVSLAPSSELPKISYGRGHLIHFLVDASRENPDQLEAFVQLGDQPRNKWFSLGTSDAFERADEIAARIVAKLPGLSKRTQVAEGRLAIGGGLPRDLR